MTPVRPRRRKSLRNDFPATGENCPHKCSDPFPLPSQALPKPTMPSLFSPRSLRFHSPTSKKLTHPKIPMGITDDVTPQSPVEKQPIIGLIGMGAMGTMYAQQFVDAGWKKCVLPQPDLALPPRSLFQQDLRLRSSKQV